MNAQEYESNTRRVIWTSSRDLSPEGIAAFCKDVAPRYGKKEEELLALSPMELAITYMLWERTKKLQELKKVFSVPCDLPLLVILDKADFGGRSHMECNVLSGETLSQILSCPEDGLSVTFYSDGRDIRCESLTMDGADHYLFREITDLKGFGALTQRIVKGDAFTESELSQNTKSLHSKVSKLLRWDNVQRIPLQKQISNAQDKANVVNQKSSENDPVLPQDARAL